MAKIEFPFEKRTSDIFGNVWRPIAKVDFWSKLTNNWVEIIALVDTGADYTLLPKYYAQDLGVDLKRDCTPFLTLGVGGNERVYLLKRAKVKLGPWEKKIPVGFLSRDNIPPLLGRQDFLEVFKVIFNRHITSFRQSGKSRR